MSIVKSYSFSDGDIRGDMFYILHNSSNFTIIDCNLQGEKKRINEILDEVSSLASKQTIHRFILTHPDKDHYSGIEKLFAKLPTENTYAVDNEALSNKTDESSKACEKMIKAENTRHIVKGLSRKYLNEDGEVTKQSGISFLWPEIDNQKFKEALQQASKGESPNNLSPVILYSVENSAKFMWLGDMEINMQEEFYRVCKNEIEPIDVLFAPHHGRKSGSMPAELLKQLNPKIIIIGDAPNEEIDYLKYGSDKTITQNSAGDIILEATDNQVHVFASKNAQNLPQCLHKLTGLTPYPGTYYLGTLTLMQP